MPTLSMFYGILIRMMSERGGKHHLPHVHVEYSGHQAAIGLDGTVLEGDLPGRQLRMVLVWIDLHRDELEANWKVLQEGQPHFRIDPLK